MKRVLAILAAGLFVVGANAAVVSTFDVGTMNDGSDLPVTPMAGDLIDGVAPPTVNAFRGTLNGFRDIAPVPAPADQFPAYTDAAFGGGLHGLLVDNEPVVSGDILQDITYDLAGDTVTEIRVFNGNADARQFTTLVLELSFDGTNFVGVGADSGYFQPAGINTNDPPPGWGTVMRIYDDGGAPLGTGVQAVRFKFFASGNNNPQRFVDPYDGVNPFTGTDDGQAAANQAPLIREIDILPEPTSLGLLVVGALAMLRRR
jgi:hypothetical protein